MPVPPSLAETLVAIEVEPGGQFDRGVALVERLISEFGEVDLAERFDQAIPIESSWEVVANLFGILLWSASDNVAAISQATDGWFRGEVDLRRIRVALHRDGDPFLDRSEEVSPGSPWLVEHIRASRRGRSRGRGE